MSNYILEVLRASAVWFEPIESVTDCRDTKDPNLLGEAIGQAGEAVHPHPHGECPSGKFAGL